MWVGHSLDVALPWELILGPQFRRPDYEILDWLNAHVGAGIEWGYLWRGAIADQVMWRFDQKLVHTCIRFRNQSDQLYFQLSWHLT